MESIFRDLTIALAAYIEAGAALVIGYAAVEALVRTVALVVLRRSGESGKEAIRLRLGRWLSVALEFELAADILRTAVTPTWKRLGQTCRHRRDPNRHQLLLTTRNRQGRADGGLI